MLLGVRHWWGLWCEASWPIGWCALILGIVLIVLAFRVRRAGPDAGAEGEVALA